MFRFRVSVVVVVRRQGSSEEGHPPPAWSMFGLTGSIPSVNTAPEAGRARLSERPEHLPPGAGKHTPTGRTAGTH